MQYLPTELIGCIAPFLDRKSLGALCCTNKSINKFVMLKVKLFLQWPTFSKQVNPTDRKEMIHFVKSPDGTKLCIVSRQYGAAGMMCVYDVRTGPLCVVNVNHHFVPVFSPSSDLVIAGSVSINDRGVLIGRISSSDNKIANKKCMCYEINWHNRFNEYATTGATFVNRDEVWISHTSGGEHPRLSYQYVYRFRINTDPLCKCKIRVSNLQQCPFTVPINEVSIRMTKYALMLLTDISARILTVITHLIVHT